MKRSLKKLISAILVVVLCCSTLVIAPITTSAASIEDRASVGMSLVDLKNKFPNGAYWNHVTTYGHTYNDTWHVGTCNNPDGYTWSPCYSHSANAPVGYCDCNEFQGAQQCMGFARKISYDVYGYSCRDWGKANVWNCKAGDVIHYFGAGADTDWGHWSMVIGRSGNTLTLGEANYVANCYISWGRTIDIGSFSSATCYSAPWELPTDGPKANVLDYGNEFYGLIKNNASGSVIGQTEGGNIEVMSLTATTVDKVLWHFTKNSDNSYRIQSMYNGKYLDVAGAVDANGTNIQGWVYNDHPAQRWTCYRYDNGYSFMKSGCSGRVLDLNGGYTADGTNIQIWEANGTNAQNFSPYDISNDDLTVYYSISAKNNKISAGQSTQITVSGQLNYVYNYKFHIVNENKLETVINNGCNPVLEFSAENEGDYIIYAEVNSPYRCDTGSVTYKAVTVNVGCAHNYTQKFIDAGKTEGYGYVLNTCTKCGEIYKDDYIDYKDGWYYNDKLPAGLDTKDCIVEYDNYYEKIQKDAPDSSWQNEGFVKYEWQNSGAPFTTYIEQTTSDSRVLVEEYYYHWCIPGASMGSEGNYEQTPYFSHYDQITLPYPWIHVTFTGNDNGHPYYTLAWENGAGVYCKAYEQCDGSDGYHDYKCRAWYKNYVYQDRVEVALYKYTKTSGWVDSADETATNTACRFKSAGILGDVDIDGKVSVNDATLIQRSLSGIAELDSAQKQAADVNKDGKVDINDATLIQRYIAQVVTSLG